MTGLGGVLPFSFTKSKEEDTRCYFNDEGVMLLLKQKRQQGSPPSVAARGSVRKVLVGGQHAACEMG